MVVDILLCFPDQNLLFHFCKDTSYLQLGFVILQQILFNLFILANFLLFFKIIQLLKRNYSQCLKPSGIFTPCYLVQRFIFIQVIQILFISHLQFSVLFIGTALLKILILHFISLRCWLPHCTTSFVEKGLNQLESEPDDNTETFYIESNNFIVLECLFYIPILPDEIIFQLEYS